MSTLIIFWKHLKKQEELQVGGIDLDPSGTFWYWYDDPNVRVEVTPSDYCWARIVS